MTRSNMVAAESRINRNDDDDEADDRKDCECNGGDDEKEEGTGGGGGGGSSCSCGSIYLVVMINDPPSRNVYPGAWKKKIASGHYFHTHTQVLRDHL